MIDQTKLLEKWERDNDILTDVHHGQVYFTASIKEMTDLIQRVYQAGVDDTLDKLREAAEKKEHAIRLLENLYALVKGESPSLLNEDSGGDVVLALEIEIFLLEN